MADDSENPNFSPEQWSEMKTRYNKAKDLLQRVADLHVKFETAQVNLKSAQTEIEKISTDARERFISIENAKNDSATFITEIKGHLEQVNSSLILLNEGLIKFEGVKGKIEGKDGEIENLVSTANSLKVDIEKAKVDALQRLDDISGLFAQVQDKITEMQGVHDIFVGIREKILDGKTGLEAILNQAQTLNTQSQKVFTEITSYRDQSKKYLEEIEKNKNSSDIIYSEIDKNLSKSKDKLYEVEKITGLVADMGLANSFQKRERMLRWSSGAWLLILVLSVGGLAWLLYSLFKDYFIVVGGATTVPEIPVLILRITLTSPLLFMIGIATHNYSKERNLNEKYAFKATTAEVMRSHADFLVETSKKTTEENAVFVRNTIKNLYSEPFETNHDMKKINKELRSILDKNTDRKFNVTEMVNKVKELKELIPDETQLKSIMDVLIKFK